MTSDDPHNQVATDAYVQEAIRLMRASREHFSDAGRAVILAAQEEARALDDNHCGTEHVVLAQWARAPNGAVDALEAVGVTREVFCSQLAKEAGPSQQGAIPYTPRAMMIGGLALLEARRLGISLVSPELVLLGTLREAERWATEKAAGPQHLRSALTAAGSSPDELETAILRRLP